MTASFIPAPTGWVAKVGTGNYRSVVAFDAESGDPVLVDRPDLPTAGAVVGVFYAPEKVPGEPSDT